MENGEGFRPGTRSGAWSVAGRTEHRRSWKRSLSPGIHRPSALAARRESAYCDAIPASGSFKLPWLPGDCVRRTLSRPRRLSFGHRRLRLDARVVEGLVHQVILGFALAAEIVRHQGTPSSALPSPIRKDIMCGNEGRSGRVKAFWCMPANRRVTTPPLTCSTASKSPVKKLNTGQSSCKGLGGARAISFYLVPGREPKSRRIVFRPGPHVEGSTS